MVTTPDKRRLSLPAAAPVSVRAAGKRRPVKARRLAVYIIRSVAGFLFRAALAVIVWLYISYMLSAEPEFSVFVNGRESLIVSDPATVTNAVRALRLNSTDVEAELGCEALPPVIAVPELDLDIKYGFRLTRPGAMLADSGECYDTLYATVQDDYTYAFALYSDGVRFAVCAHYSEAAGAVAQLEAALTDAKVYDGVGYNEVRISGGITIRYMLCKKSDIIGTDTLYTRMCDMLSLDPDTETRISAAGISSTSSISSVSSNIDPDIEYGVARVVTLNGVPLSAAPYTETLSLAVENIRTDKTEQPIDYKTVYTESEDYYIGTMFTETEGQAGVELVTTDTVIENGAEASTRIVSVETLVAAVDEVIVVGSRPLPEAVPTGSFIYPVDAPYEITSYFGEQRAEFDGDAYHYGVDFTGKKGDPIYAADGGEIIYADYSSSYGLMIEIDNGGGMISCYAHCSKLLFKKGDSVYQGQLIALIGDTGVATGPHLHFELRKNGARVNPLIYLP